MTNTHTDTLRACYAVAIAQAGTDYKWTGAATPVLSSAHVRGLRIILAERQDGLCAACGEPLDGDVELCHGVASRTYGAGIMPGTTWAGHKGCNNDDAVVYGDVVPVESLVRADLVQTAHPTRQECMVRANDDRAARVRRLAARQGR